MCDRIDEVSRLNIVLEYIQEYYRNIRNQEELISCNLESLFYKEKFDKLERQHENLMQERIYIGRLICFIEHKIERLVEGADG